AFVAADRATLLSTLRALARGEAQPGLCQGDARRGEEGFLTPEDAQLLIEQWLGAGKLERLADAWVRGMQVDFAQLTVEGARRVPLATYPFARERHWFTPAPAQAVARPAALHPLL